MAASRSALLRFADASGLRRVKQHVANVQPCDVVDVVPKPTDIEVEVQELVGGAETAVGACWKKPMTTPVTSWKSAALS